MCEDRRWNKSSSSSAVPGRAPCQERLRQSPAGVVAPAASRAVMLLLPSPLGQRQAGPGCEAGWDQGCDVGMLMLVWMLPCHLTPALPWCVLWHSSAVLSVSIDTSGALGHGDSSVLAMAMEFA